MNITIVDYGVGNLYSIKRAVEVCSTHDVIIGAGYEDIKNADRLILPGVGAFTNGMYGLASRGLVESLKDYAISGRPMLGICLGMQMLSTVSYEFAVCEGLNIIPGTVTSIPSQGVNGKNLRIPYVGWSTLVHSNGDAFKESIIEPILPSQSVYFVHSFSVTPDRSSDVLATYQYGGLEIVAAIKKDNVTGLQFHPEKSGSVGLSVLKKFILE